MKIVENAEADWSSNVLCRGCMRHVIVEALDVRYGPDSLGVPRFYALCECGTVLYPPSVAPRVQVLARRRT